jgi:hypothetical protein
MQCPHCHSELRYRERSNNTCSKCKRQFALEPKNNVLKLHDLRFKNLVDQLHQGRWYYTPDQLRHRAAHKVMVQQINYGNPLTLITCLSMPVGIIILSIALASLVHIAVGVVFGIALMALGWWLASVLEFRFAESYDIPIDLPHFFKSIVFKWQAMYHPPDGLLDQQTIKQLQDSHPDPHAVRAVVACAEPDVLVCLRANQVPEQLNVQLIPTSKPFTSTQQATIKRLQREPDLPLLVLHDASASGCALPLTIAQSLGLQANHRVIDAGIRPATEAIGQHLMWLAGKPDPAALETLKPYVVEEDSKQRRQTATHVRANIKAWRSAQLPNHFHSESIEAQKEAQKSGVGERVEQAIELEQQGKMSLLVFLWLQKGYYAPLLSLKPVQLIKMIMTALEQAGVRRASAVSDPQARAQAVGFLTWPE